MEVAAVENNIYNKLLNLRIALQKEEFKDFDELMARITIKCKYYKVLPLYCFYDNVATLTLVNIEDASQSIRFNAPATDAIGFKSVKEYLYKMAFEVDGVKTYISPKQYIEIIERMKALNVKEKSILDRYQITSLTDMTVDIYKNCIKVFEHMTKEGNK